MSGGNGVWAFWPYDLFPYLLSGEQTGRTNSSGDVETVGFGVGYFFSPAFTIRGEHGQALKERLEALRAERREAHAQIDATFSVKRNDLLAEYGISPERAAGKDRQ